jgi:hypothetical protein
MANRYWVGGTASWDATAGSKWALTSGGVGGQAVPTASDDVFFDSNSGAVTVTVATAARLCLNLDFTGFTGTFAGSQTITISGSLILVATMTRMYTGTITFNATSTKTITCNGVSLASALTFNGSGGTWTMQDALNTTGVITITSGTFSTGTNYALTCSNISSSNSNTRGITLGSSTVTITNGTILLLTVTSLTLSAASSTIIWTGASGGGISVNSGHGLSFGNIKATSLTGGTFAVTNWGALCTGDFDMTGCTGGNLNLASGTMTVGGDFILSPGMTMSSGTGIITLTNAGSKTFNPAGVTIGHPIDITGGGSYTLAGNLIQTSTQSTGFRVVNTNFNAAEYTVDAYLVALTVQSGGSIDMGSGTWTINMTPSTLSATIFNLTNNGGTFTAAPIIKLINSTATNLNATFGGAGATYGQVWYSGTSTGLLTIAGSNTYTNSFKDTGSSAHTIRITTGTTQTYADFIVSGTAGNVITITSTTTGTHALVKTGGGTINCSYLNIQHSIATPSSTWYATDSTDNQSVATAGSGWNITAAAAGSNSNFLQFF